MIFTDCIHVEIEIKDSFYIKLINSKVLQRLKNIKQQGHTYLLNKNAIHNRFDHTLGVFAITNLISDLKGIVGFEKKIALTTALLHDIGHGPYSYTFENVTNIHHEKWSELLIKNDLEIKSILNLENGLMESVLNVLRREGDSPQIEQILFSELGADKLDYIQRDYYYNFNNNPLKDDIFSIITNTNYNNKSVVVNEDILGIVQKIYKMKERLFLSSFGHEYVLGIDLMLKILLKEANYQEIRDISSFTNNPSVINTYLSMDDNYISKLIKDEIYHNDSIKKIHNLYLKKQVMRYETDNIKFNDIASNFSFSEVIQRPLKYGNYSKGVSVQLHNDVKDLSNYIPLSKYPSKIIYYV